MNTPGDAMTADPLEIETRYWAAVLSAITDSVPARLVLDAGQRARLADSIVKRLSERGLIPDRITR